MSPDRMPYVGYRAALAMEGITDACVWGVPDTTGVDFQDMHYRSFCRHVLLETRMPTAFVCAHDFRVGPLLRVLRERGCRVPDDVSIVSIGNTPWTELLDPRLTSVSLGETELARMAIMGMAQNPPERPTLIRTEPFLATRQSTAAPL